METTANKNLKYNETYTIEQFKAKTLVDRIEVKKNQKTGKLFFVYGANTGAVSEKITKAGQIPERIMISDVTTPEGQRFYLFHEEGTGGAETIAVF